MSIHSQNKLLWTRACRASAAPTNMKAQGTWRSLLTPVPVGVIHQYKEKCQHTNPSSGLCTWITMGAFTDKVKS